MNTPHTPGPWKASGRYIAAASYHLAVITSAPPEMDQEWKSNARLIAASPLLFSLLMELKEARGGKENIYGCAEKALDLDFITRVEAAINLATGQTQ